jgi:hypothetical protein
LDLVYKYNLSKTKAVALARNKPGYGSLSHANVSGHYALARFPPPFFFFLPLAFPLFFPPHLQD